MFHMVEKAWKTAKTFTKSPELGTSLFEIALERTLILGAMALSKKKRDERTDKVQILSGSLMSDIRKKERSKKRLKNK